jgi:hypothetical protein
MENSDVLTPLHPVSSPTGKVTVLCEEGGPRSGVMGIPCRTPLRKKLFDGGFVCILIRPEQNSRHRSLTVSFPSLL